MRTDRGPGAGSRSADPDADCATLTRAGAAVEGPTDLLWGRQATLAAPDGNSFVLQAPTGS